MFSVFYFWLSYFFSFILLFIKFSIKLFYLNSNFRTFLFKFSNFALYLCLLINEFLVFTLHFIHLFWYNFLFFLFLLQLFLKSFLVHVTSSILSCKNKVIKLCLFVFKFSKLNCILCLISNIIETLLNKFQFVLFLYFLLFHYI